MSRIIAGAAKGARLSTPAHSRTRPTTDRVREALFSSLVTWAGTTDQPADRQLAGLGILDLFAGTGAVGLEAASRGAAPVVLVEKDAATAKLAAGNARTTGLQAKVVTASVASFLAGPPPASFDIVFADPPYEHPNHAITELLESLLAGGWLAPDALVVLERATRDAAPGLPALLCDTWTRRYGETSIFYLRAPEPDPQNGANRDE